MSKKKKFQVASEPEAPKKPEVSEATKNQMSAVKALINVYDLLQIGSYQGNYAVRLKEAQDFIKALHGNALKELQNAEDFVQAMASAMPATEVANEQKN